MGRGLPQQLSDSSHARERSSLSAPSRLAPESEQSRGPFPLPFLGPGPAVVRPLHVGRERHRLDRKLTPPPTAWSDMWRPDLRNRITMLDDPAEVLGACLKKLGYSINSGDPGELDKARREAVAQKPLLRAYLNAEARDQIVSGDITAAQLWATTSQQAMDAAPALGFVYPAEGFALYADNAVVLRESRRERLAHEFIDYLLRAAVAADIVKATRTATANRAVPEFVRSSATLYPPPETLRLGEWFQPLPAAAQRLRDRLWTEIKSA